jgi:hypothetical protein
MLSDWVSFLAYPNLFGIKGFVVVVELGLLTLYFLPILLCLKNGSLCVFLKMVHNIVYIQK